MVVNKPIKICDVDVHYVVFSKLIETKSNFRYLIGYLYDVVRPLVLILPNKIGYVKTFKDKDRDKDKNKNNKLFFHQG